MSWEDMSLDGATNSEGLNIDVSIEEVPWVELFGEGNNQFDETSTDSNSSLVSSTKVRRLTAGRIVATCFVGLLFSFVLFLISASLYTKYIRYPEEQERIWEESRLYALQGFETSVHNLSGSGEEGFLSKELPYANKNKDREGFIQCVAGTVKYDVGLVNKKNVYGNDFIDKKTGLTVQEPSWISEGEKVTRSYVDYSAIEFSSDVVSDLVKRSGLTKDDIDYRNKLTDLFCQYICSVGSAGLPIRSESVVIPFIPSSNGYLVSVDEDIYLDKALYSSPDFVACLERFAEAVAKVAKVHLSVSSDYRAWEKLSDLSKESVLAPPKYGKHSIGRQWCGAYYLANEYTSGGEVSPQLGDGSKEQPASVGTPVITSVIVTGPQGEEKKLPIRVTLVEFGVSQKAIDWFQAKDIQNRGYDVTSELQYCYCIFEVTNLSTETLSVYDNMSLCDSNANISGRTGTIYGLQSSVVLDPEETGYIETWGRSTELNLKYMIWGADFARKAEPVWFRVLAGDLEDPSWEKGVYINDSRGG